MMETTTVNDAAKRLFNKQNRTNTLLGIVGWVCLALGVILFSFGLWPHFHSAGGPLIAAYRDSTVYVEASYGREAKIPSDAELRASLVMPENDPDAYMQKMAAAMTAMGRDSEAAPANAIYNVGFYVGDQEVEPAAPVNVVIQVLQDGFAIGQPIKVIHLGENDARVIADTSVDDAGFISFTTDGFSNFAFISQQNKGVSRWNEIKEAAGKNENSVYQLATDITADSPCAVTGSLTIDLNGYTIKSSGINSSSKASNGIEGYVMAVDGSLTIMDSSNGSGKFTISGGSPYGLVYVGTGGVLTLEGGIFEDGGGFHAIRVAGGTLIMNGGTIQNSGSTTDSGGGSPIYVNNGGNLEINGGTIKNNNAGKGGAIQFESSGNFTMTGGEITGNTVTGNGGGLYFKDCTGQIKFEGGTISNNRTSSDAHGGGMWFSGCPNITIGGTTEITKNIAATGGGIRVQDNCKLTMNGGTISQNIANGGKWDGASGIGGGIAVTKSTVEINDGTISENTATRGGGGIALRLGTADKKTVVTMNGGTISDNSLATEEEYLYGGGVYLQDYSDFTMKGGTISGNHCIGQGGGISTDYSGLGYECVGEMKVTINGGTITKNYSELHEGGGIGMGSGKLFIEAMNGNKVYITENESRTTQHWGGGGIMISQKSEAVIVNALIADNTAGGFGGGLGACSTGHVYYGVGDDANNPSALAAIFGNSAAGTNLSGGDSKKDADHTAYNNSVFMNSGYQDVYSALEAVISGAMLGGGDEAWTGSADGAPVTVGKDGFASASQMLGLTSHSSAADQERARAAASVLITGNHSNTHGGGIMCNGSLAMGWNTKMDVTPGLAIKGTKQYEVKDGNAKDVPEFQFAISNEKPTWVPDTEGTSGHWEAKEGIGVFTTKNSVDGTFAFDLTFEQTPGLQKKTGEQTFYFWEVNEGGNGVTYDPALYKVTVSVTSTTEKKTAAGATLTINTWSIVNGSAKVEKWAPETNNYTSVTVTQTVEKNENSKESMHWTTRTVVTLNGTTFTNSYDGSAKLSIKKVDEDGNSVEGAKFTLYRKDESGEEKNGWEGKWKIAGEYASNASGIIYADDENTGENLSVGTYRLVETEAPDGWKLLPNYIEFEIKGTGSYRMISCPYSPVFSEYAKVVDNGLTLQVKNTLAKCSLRMIKVNKDSPEKGLPYAEFELWSTKPGGDGTLVEDQKLWTAVSDENGQLLWKKAEDTEDGSDESSDLTLTAGTYFLKETKAPNGFFPLEKPITVTVDIDEKVTFQSEEVELQQKDGETVLTFLLPNTSSYRLPESGGPGTLFYLLTGLVLVVGSAVILFTKRRLHRAQ